MSDDRPAVTDEQLAEWERLCEYVHLHDDCNCAGCRTNRALQFAIAEIRRLREDRDGWNRNACETAGMLAENCLRMADMKEELADLRKQLADYKAAAEAEAGLADEANEMVAKIDLENERLRADNERHKAKNRELNERCQAAESEAASLKRFYSGELTAYKEQYDRLRAENAAMRELLQSLRWAGKIVDGPTHYSCCPVCKSKGYSFSDPNHFKDCAYDRVMNGTGSAAHARRMAAAEKVVEAACKLRRCASNTKAAANKLDETWIEAGAEQMKAALALWDAVDAYNATVKESK